MEAVLLIIKCDLEKSFTFFLIRSLQENEFGMSMSMLLILINFSSIDIFILLTPQHSGPTS
jgi:hypothetical protein